MASESLKPPTLTSRAFNRSAVPQVFCRTKYPPARAGILNELVRWLDAALLCGAAAQCVVGEGSAALSERGADPHRAHSCSRSLIAGAI
jgi:hypothetical protein